MTALRSCAACSASGKVPTVVAIAMACLPVSFVVRSLACRRQVSFQRYFGASAMAIANGSQGDPVPPRPCIQISAGAVLLLGGPTRCHHGDRGLAIVVRKHLLKVIELR